MILDRQKPSLSSFPLSRSPSMERLPAVGEQFRKLMTVKMGFNGDCNPNSSKHCQRPNMKKQVLFQADCKANRKINICQNHLQMRFLLILECHKNLEGLKGNLKKIITCLWISFINLEYLSLHFTMYFQIAMCDVAQCYKAEEVFLPTYSLSSLVLYEK